MYTQTNYKTKKALKEALAEGKTVRVYQPGPFGGNEPDNGTVYLEGPHYPAAHLVRARGAEGWKAGVGEMTQNAKDNVVFWTKALADAEGDYRRWADPNKTFQNVPGALSRCLTRVNDLRENLDYWTVKAGAQ